jgi:tRNA A22 N-methylase
MIKIPQEDPKTILKESATIYQILEYEIFSSRFARKISFEFGQTLSAKYYAWKVKRKYKRYKNTFNLKYNSDLQRIIKQIKEENNVSK